MSPLEESILAEQLENSIDNTVLASISISQRRHHRMMSRLAYKVLVREYKGGKSGQKHFPRLHCKRGPKPKPAPEVK